MTFSLPCHVPQHWLPKKPPKVDNLGRSFGLGRRKRSVARVWVTLSDGEGGVFVINRRPMSDYFTRDVHQNEVCSTQLQVGLSFEALFFLNKYC